MTLFHVARGRSMPSSTLAWLTAIGVAAFVLVAGATPLASAQRPAQRGTSGAAAAPRRFFVLSKNKADDRNDGLAVIEPDTGTWTQLAQDVQRGGRLSPDDNRYAWFLPEYGGRTTLRIEDLVKQGEPAIRRFEGTGVGCCWAPDGRELIVTTYHPSKLELIRLTWRVAADGSKSRKLPIPETETVWDWSRDGRWLVTTSGSVQTDEAPLPPGREDVRMIHPDGSGSRLVHHLAGSSPDEAGATVRTSPPRFAPDGRSLLWIETEWGMLKESRTPMVRRVMIKDADGDAATEVIRVGDAQKQLAGACWSPDGKSLVLHIVEGSGYASDARFEVVDMKGRPIRSLDARRVPDAKTRVIVELIECR
jgi:dipeptidyl aminopeptidase/acylaminoacyl peptidase